MSCSNMASLLIRLVSTVPGQTALTEMPEGPSSVAMVWVNRMIPALAAQYGPRNGNARFPAWLETLHIRPFWFSAIIRLAQALDTSQVPMTFTSRTRRNSSTGMLRSGPSPNPGPLPPATLATRVTVPNSSLTWATAFSTSSTTDTSATAVADVSVEEEVE